MLTISSKVLADIIQSLGSTNFETGGLIGSSAEIIDTFHFDKGMSESVSEYIPNVDALKQQLSDWQKNGIAFKGFIHSHLMSRELIHVARHSRLLLVVVEGTRILNLFLTAPSAVHAKL